MSDTALENRRKYQKSQLAEVLGVARQLIDIANKLEAAIEELDLDTNEVDMANNITMFTDGMAAGAKKIRQITSTVESTEKVIGALRALGEDEHAVNS